MLYMKIFIILHKAMQESEISLAISKKFTEVRDTFIPYFTSFPFQSWGKLVLSRNQNASKAEWTLFELHKTTGLFLVKMWDQQSLM